MFLAITKQKLVFSGVTDWVSSNLFILGAIYADSCPSYGLINNLLVKFSNFSNYLLDAEIVRN